MKLFDKFASKTTEYTGSSFAFIAAVLLILLWGIVGPLMSFSNTWQLICNTATTIITFLMVFLIQNSQNREQEDQKKREKDSLKDTQGIKKMLNAIIEGSKAGKK